MGCAQYRQMSTDTAVGDTVRDRLTLVEDVLGRLSQQRSVVELNGEEAVARVVSVLVDGVGLAAEG